MLREFLCDIGLICETESLELSRILGPFSTWVEHQTVQDEDRFYLASRIGAFICEYMIDAGLAERLIVDNRIVLRLPITAKIQREYDPYPIALAIADKQATLQQFIDANSGKNH